jgi:glycosyltransferase involved in cell wall biosynthesis
VDGSERPIASGLKALREPPGVRRRLAMAPRYLRRFRRFVRSVDPAVVHSNSLYSFAEALTSRALGVPTVLHLHDMAPTSWKSPIVRWICRHGANGCFAVSEACARSYATGGWAPRVVHGGAPIPDAAVTPRSDPRPFVFGTVGVLSQRKGTDLFVAAAERVRRVRDDVEFRLVGAAADPLDRQWGLEVAERAQAAGIEHLESADVEAQMREWDAFVLPSRRDPFPLVMLEAMALGLPVIGARVDGIPEQIGDRDAGVLVEPDDAAGLAQAMSTMADRSQSDRAAMGRAARERIAERFTLPRLADGTDTVYRAVAGRV